MTQLVKIVCSACGSDDVRKDAWAAWNVEKQAWELAAEFDEPNVCEVCEGECSLIEMPAGTRIFGLQEAEGFNVIDEEGDIAASFATREEAYEDMRRRNYVARANARQAA